MYVQLCKSHQYHLQANSFVISIYLLLLQINIPIHHAKVDYGQYHYECSKVSTFSCGKTALSPSYPFWDNSAGGRPSYCGLEGFGLLCNDFFPSIDIGFSLHSYESKSVYRVANINPNGRAIILERIPNQLGYDTCVPYFDNTTLNRKLFKYSPGIEDLYMFYGCPLELLVPVMSGVRNNFTCTSDVGGDEEVIFGVQSHLVDYLDTLHKVCETVVRVPVTRSNLEKFSMNVTMLLEELLDSSFEVQYKINETACLDCIESGGLCWNNTNSGVYPKCLSLTEGEKNSRPKIRPNIGIASGTAGGGVVLLLVLIVCYRRLKTKHDSFIISQNVSSHTKDIEAFIYQISINSTIV